MKRIWFTMAMAFLLTLSVGSASAMDIRVEAVPEWQSGKIALNTPFSIDIYMDNADTVDADPTNGYRLGISMPFAFLSDDASMSNISHIDVGGDGPTGNIEVLNGFDGFFNMIWMISPWSYDGALPDSLNFTGIGMTGWPNDLGEQLYLRFHFESAETGSFCIDSIGGQNPTFDWLLDDPSPDFGGPYCWEIVDTNVTPNEAPVLTPTADQVEDENSLLTFTVSATDADGDSVMLSMSSDNLPPAATFTENGDGGTGTYTGTFNWTPGYDDAGIYSAIFTADDGTEAVSDTIQITINNSNRAPVLAAITNYSLVEGMMGNFSISATDPDGDSVMLYMVSADLPPAATFTEHGDGGTGTYIGTFEWMVGYDDSGHYSATFYADDGADSVFQTIQITVTNTNRPPVLEQVASGTQYVDTGDTLTFLLSASDPDGDIPQLLAQFTMDSVFFADSGNGHGLFMFYPDETMAGADYTVRFIARDSETAEDYEDVFIHVNELIPPELSVTPDTLFFYGNVCDGGVTPEEMDTLTIAVANIGGGEMNWFIGADSGFVVFNPAGGTDAGTVDVWLEWSFIPDTALAVGETAELVQILTFTAEGAVGSPKEVVVLLTLTCDPGGYFLEVDPPSFEFNISAMDTVGGAFDVTEMYGQEVQFSYSNNEIWLQTVILPDPPTTPTSIPFILLNAGYTNDTTLYDTIVVTSIGEPSNTPIYIPVTVNIKNDFMLASTPTSFDYTLDIGESVLGDSLLIYESTDTASIYFSIAHNSSWLFVDTGDGFPGPSNHEMFTPRYLYLNIFADDTLLVGETYYDTIFVSSDVADNSPLAIPVTMTITADYVVSTLPSAFNFMLFEGQAAGDMLNVYEIHGRAIGFLYYNTSSWLAVNPGGIEPYQTPLSLPIGVSAVGLTPGLYYDTILITPDVDSSVFPVVAVPVTLQVEEFVPITEDSVWLATVPARAGTDVAVPIYFRNFETLIGMNIPLTWNSDDLFLNEVTFDGTRVELVDNKPVVIDNGTRRVLIDIAPTFSGPIVPGRGLMAKLHFSVVPGADPAFIAIYDTIIVPSGGLAFVDDMYNIITPHFDTGGVIIGPDSAYLCGRVIDTAGNEIENAFVEIWNNWPDGFSILSDTTDIAGQFACHSVGISPFDVYAYKEGYYPGLVEDVQLGELGIEVVLTPVSPVIPTNEWVGFYCDDDYYSGVPLPVGTVIDAYDPDGTHCGIFYVHTPGSYGIMPVYRDDIYSEEDEGALPGDTISFFINGYPANADGDRIWTQMGDNFEVCLDIYTVEEKTFLLKTGWNLISWNVDTPNDDILEVLAPITDCMTAVYSFENGGLTYDPTLPEFSTLWEVDHFHGFWILMDCDAVLTVIGSPVSAVTPIALEKGWNLVSYLPTVTDTIPQALGSIENQLIAAIAYINNTYLAYDPTEPDYSNLYYMTPGYGYWIKVTADGTLVYPGVGPPVSFRQPFQPAGVDVAKSVIGQEIAVSRQWMNLYTEQLRFDGQTVPAGAEVQAVTSDGRVIGAGFVSDDGRFGFMPVYGDDPATTEIDGIRGDERFILVIDGVESAESFIWSTHGDKLEIGPLTARTGAELLPMNFKLAQNYPNPFNPTTTILFSLPEPMSATVEVYNILGEKVNTIFDGMAGAGENSVVWHGDNESGQSVASGIYFYRMKAGDFAQSRKMILLK